RRLELEVALAAGLGVGEVRDAVAAHAGGEPDPLGVPVGRRAAAGPGAPGGGGATAGEQRAGAEQERNGVVSHAASGTPPAVTARSRALLPARNRARTILSRTSGALTWLRDSCEAHARVGRGGSRGAGRNAGHRAAARGHGRRRRI